MSEGGHVVLSTETPGRSSSTVKVEAGGTSRSSLYGEALRLQRLVGNRAVTMLVQRKPPRQATPIPPSPRRQAMVNDLVDEHPGLNRKVASDAVDAAFKVMGKGGAGGDAVLARVTREVSVHQGRVDAPTMVRVLQREAAQAGVREVYLQVDAADRRSIRTTMNSIQNGVPELAGVRVRVYTADGRVAWAGNMRFRDTNPIARRPPPTSSAGGAPPPSGPTSGPPGQASAAGGAATTTGAPPAARVATPTTPGASSTDRAAAPPASAVPTSGAAGPVAQPAQKGSGSRSTRSRDVADIVKEMARAQAVGDGLRLAAQAVTAYIQARKLYDMVVLVASARNMAAGTIANPRGPYHAHIEQSETVASRAEQLKAEFFGLDVFSMLPTIQEMPLLSRDEVFNAQYIAVRLEGQLREALGDAESAIRSLEHQKRTLRDTMQEKLGALILSPVTLPYADVTLFADAAGQVIGNIDQAIESYRAASNAIRLERGKAQAMSKAFELRLRSEGGAGMFGDIPDKDLQKAPLPDFSIY